MTDKEMQITILKTLFLCVVIDLTDVLISAGFALNNLNKELCLAMEIFLLIVAAKGISLKFKPNDR